MKRILVTGVKGFIGKNLYNSIDRNQYEVYGIDDEYLDGDWKLNLSNILTQINPNIIFHIGACSNTLESDVNYMMIRNYESTKFFSNWAYKKTIRLIYSSSAANYGINNDYPSNLYGWSKYAAEDYVINSNQIALRYFNVYGDGEEQKGNMASVAYQMYIKSKNDEEILLFPKEPRRDFVYIKDIIDANLFALEKYTDLYLYNFHKSQPHMFDNRYFEVGSGEARTFEDVLNLMEIKFKYHDEDKIPEGYQFYTCSDSKKWMPGWSPKYNLERGIGEYKNYLLKE